MIQVFLYDKNNIFTESKFVEEISNNMTTVPILIGYIKPKFNTDLNEWIEGATPQEVKEWEESQPKFEQKIDRDEYSLELDFEITMLKLGM